MIDIEWPDNIPVSDTLTVTVSSPLVRYPDPVTEAFYISERLRLTRMVVEGPDEDVRPFVEAVRKLMDEKR